jgi:hypothetical protein
MDELSPKCWKIITEILEESKMPVAEAGKTEVKDNGST